MNVLFGESLAVSPRWEFSHLPSSLLVQLLCARSGGQGGVGAPGWLACNYQTTQPLVFRDLSEFHPNLSFISLPHAYLLFIFPNIHAPKIKVSHDGHRKI